MNPARGVYLVDMPVQGRRAAPAYGTAVVPYDRETVSSGVPVLVVAPSMGVCRRAPGPSTVPSTW